MLHMFCPSALIEMASPAVKSGLSKLETCDFSAQQDSAALMDISRHSRLGLETRNFWKQDSAPLADISRHCRLGLETRNFWQQDSAPLADITRHIRLGLETRKMAHLRWTSQDIAGWIWKPETFGRKMVHLWWTSQDLAG